MIRSFSLNLLLSLILAGFGSAETNIPSSPIPPDTNEVTPLTLPGAESSVFKKVGDVELRLHVVKPKDWKATDKRACLVTFFGEDGPVGHRLGVSPMRSGRGKTVWWV